MSTMLGRIQSFWKQSRFANGGFLAVLLLLQIVIHLPMINLSPRGMHVWRQVVGHAAIQNYVKEDDRFWYPRADIRMTADDTGEIYHELPLTYWLAAKTTRAGLLPLNTAAHAVQLLFNLLLIPGAFFSFSALGYSRQRCALFTFLMSFSPLYLYYGPLLEPNMLGLSFFLAGAALFLPAVKKGAYGLPFALSVFCLGLATTAKPTFLFFGLPLAVYALPYIFQQKNYKGAACLTVAGGFILLVNIAIIRHAQTLYNLSPWQRQFHTPIAAPPFPESWGLVWDNVLRASTTWFLEMNLNLAAMPLLLIACAMLWKSQKDLEAQTQRKLFWWAWCVSLAIYCTLFVVRLGDHDYYIAASLPLAALISSRGADVWLRSNRFKPLLAFILLIAVPYIGITRAYGRWNGHPQVPVSLLEHGAEISTLIPKNELVLVDGDKTPIVFLYYLQRKGLSLGQVEGTVSDDELKPFRWLIRWNKAENLSPIAKRLKLTSVVTLDDFTVFRVVGNQEIVAH
ncbi:MAG: hypothetical protein H7249_14250 [Chitinophagaceae bacterium]|nr:hypothetical protein [Oligoflexus sp.]